MVYIMHRDEPVSVCIHYAHRDEPVSVYTADDVQILHE